MRISAPVFTTVSALKVQELEKYDAIAIAVHKRDSALILDSNPLLTTVFHRIAFDFDHVQISWPDFAAKSGELLELPVKDAGKISRIYLIGVGAGGVEDYRKAGASLGRKVKGNGFTTLVTFFGNGSDSHEKQSVIAAFSAISISQYGFEMKSALEAGRKPKKPASTFVVSAALSAELERAGIISDAVWNARDLIHTPSNIKNPAWMAAQAKSLVAATKSPALSVSVKSGRALAAFGGLRAVGNSVPVPGPRLIEVRYAPTGSRNWPHVVLVGKGITFDTGGISLKRPYDTMIAMKSDMAGAAAILAATTAMAKIKPRVRITALLMCAENMVSGTAQRPSDVITHFGGTTVEVLNTDAEGQIGRAHV